MDNTLEDRKNFYHILARKMRILILAVSLIPLMLTAGILSYRFHLVYVEKVRAHASELVQKHTQNIDAFLFEKLGNIRYLARGYKDFGPDRSRAFLTENLAALKDEYGDVFTDLGLVDENGVQFAYAGPFRLENADYSDAKWFVASREKPDYISDVFAGLRGHPHFIIAVKTGPGRSDPILRATINFAAFNSLVGNIRLGRTGLAFIVNREGELQTHARDGISETILRDMADSSRTDAQGRSFYADTRDSDGTSYLYVSSTFNHIDWRMVFFQALGDALADQRRAQVLTLVFFSLGCIAILSVALILPRKIVNLIESADRKNQAMNKQVVESGKLASIGELAAGIAHEINNPVAIMVEEAGWMGDLLEDEDPDPGNIREEFRRSINQIGIQGQRCKDITHKLLSFARKTEVPVADLQVNEAIEEIVALTAQMAKYSNVSMETDLGPDLPYIRISPAELQQIILNLVNNAIDAMGKAGGTIRIETRAGTPEGVVIVFSDNGPGIPEGNLGRIFDPFFTTKSVGKGTGLGLSICYGIIRKMGGSIEVQSRMGQGTRFEIMLPVHLDECLPPEELTVKQENINESNKPKRDERDEIIVCG